MTPVWGSMLTPDWQGAGRVGQRATVGIGEGPRRSGRIGHSHRGRLGAGDARAGQHRGLVHSRCGYHIEHVAGAHTGPLGVGSRHRHGEGAAHRRGWRARDDARLGVDAYPGRQGAGRVGQRATVGIGEGPRRSGRIGHSHRGRLGAGDARTGQHRGLVAGRSGYHIEHVAGAHTGPLGVGSRHRHGERTAHRRGWRARDDTRLGVDAYPGLAGCWPSRSAGHRRDRRRPPP